MTNGGYFNMIDVVANEIVYSKLVPGVSQAWGHTVAPDGSVYIAKH
ncbi:hypothetical protein MGH68_16725 [Erysipelothrix sp. D19-032]